MKPGPGVEHLDAQHAVRERDRAPRCRRPRATCSTALATSSETQQPGVVEDAPRGARRGPARAARGRARANRVTSGAFPSRTWAVRRLPAVPEDSHASFHCRAPTFQRHRRASSCAASWTWRRARAPTRSCAAPRPTSRRVLVLDLREVTFFDSTGLQLVLDADVRAREEGRTFIVACPATASRGASSSSPRWPTGSSWRSERWAMTDAFCAGARPDRHRLPAHRPAARGPPDRLRQPVVPEPSPATPRTRCSGRNCRFLQGARHRPGARSTSCGARSPSERPATVELRNYRQGRHAVLERGPHLAGARRARRGRALRRRAGRRHRPPRAAAAARAPHRARSGARRFLAEAEPAARRLARPGSTLDSLTGSRSRSWATSASSTRSATTRCAGWPRRRATRTIERSCASCRAAYPVDADDPLVRVVARAGSAGDRRRRAALRPAGEAAMIVPLKARGTIARRRRLRLAEPSRRYGADDLVLAEDLARRAALALDNARLYENLGAVARSLQQGLLPQRLPMLAGHGPRGALPARGRRQPDRRRLLRRAAARRTALDLVIGDVTGKGARAAALTAQVRHTLRTAARYEASPERGAGRRQPHADGRARRERALLHGRDVPRRAQRLGAGDDLLRRAPAADGRARRRGDDRARRPAGLRARLGAGPEAARHRRSSSADGESLVLFTDGVTEARTTGDAYGLGGLEELLRAAARRGRGGRSPRAWTAPRRARASAATTSPCSSLDAQELPQAEAGAQRRDRDRRRQQQDRDQQPEVDRVRRRDQREVRPPAGRRPRS